jgi:RNA polymerase-interacting CarD/CdnL/TRCF family regulator
MYEQVMDFRVGDVVVHWAYGLGKIVQLEEKNLSGDASMFYVVKIRDMTLWVPIKETGESCLRMLTPARDFQELFLILGSPGEPLSTDRLERKLHLADLMKKGTLKAVCQVIRDLTYQKRTKKLNDNDNTILNRAKSFLLDEWSICLAVPVKQVEQELRGILDSI